MVEGSPEFSTFDSHIIACKIMPQSHGVYINFGNLAKGNKNSVSYWFQNRQKVSCYFETTKRSIIPIHFPARISEPEIF